MVEGYLDTYSENRVINNFSEVNGTKEVKLSDYVFLPSLQINLVDDGLENVEKLMK